MGDHHQVKVLFVCMGNICRSPAAEGILKHLVKDQPDVQLYVKSCGIGDWHVGQLPDKRMQEASQLRGVALTERAQQFQQGDFDTYDYILAADDEVLNFLYHLSSSPNHKVKIHLMTHFGHRYRDQEVPDPYYSSSGAFGQVLDILEDACMGLITHLKSSR